jgi:hypothetical protein
MQRPSRHRYGALCEDIRLTLRRELPHERRVRPRWQASRGCGGEYGGHCQSGTRLIGRFFLGDRTGPIVTSRDQKPRGAFGIYAAIKIESKIEPSAGSSLVNGRWACPIRRTCTWLCARLGERTCKRAGSRTPAIDEPKVAAAVHQPTADEVCRTLEEAAAENALPVEFFARVIWQESRFNARAVSSKGAAGIAQFMHLRRGTQLHAA